MIKNWRPFIRNVLQRLLHAVDKTHAPEPVTRGKESIWNREIALPSYLVAAVSMAAFFTVLVFEVGFSFYKIIGLVIFLGMIFSFFIYFVTKAEKYTMEDAESIMLVGLIFTSAALLMAVFKGWLSPIACPVAAFCVLVGLLLSKRLAIVTAIILSMIIAVLNNFSFEYFLLHFFSSLTGIAFLSGIRHRSDITRLGFILAAANALTILVLHFFLLWPLRLLWVNISWAVLGGFISAALVIITLPYLESFFSKITNIKLLELADFNQPILKRLMVEAPGTYHHSLMMASIAEQAAEAIGANPLLARVGAYYHDVGKLSHPEYFIENQKSGEDPHGSLTPAMSGLIVSSHVKEGVALAKQYKLDKAIIDCIQEHHGTSLMHFFYQRALEQSSDTIAENYRYPGPKPRSKVSAILMLADASEAASRALEDPSAGQLKDTVEKVINNKFTDGQFSECPITLKDLNTIAESMVATLGGIYHARVEYKEIPGSEQAKS